MNKLNFENLSPFLKSGFYKKQSNNNINKSGSTTHRDHDIENRSTIILKSARNPSENRQYSAYNMQQILNSSTRLNSQPCNITPKKNCSYNNNCANGTNNSYIHQNGCNNVCGTTQDYSASQYCRTHENQSSLSPNGVKQSPIFTKPTKDKDDSQKSLDELKRLKGEVESFKNREIKYLVRIASLEKDNKRLAEIHCRLEHENKMMKNELCNFSKHNRKLTYTQLPTQSQGTQFQQINQQQQTMGSTCKDELFNAVQKLDKGVQVCSSTKSEYQIALLEEYTRVIKRKMKEIEQGNSQANSAIKQRENSDSFQQTQKLKANYEHLKSKYNELLEKYYRCEKDSYEAKSESVFLKKYLKERYSYSVLSRSTTATTNTNFSLNDTKSMQAVSSRSTDHNFDSQDLVPSFLKVLNLTAAMKQ